MTFELRAALTLGRHLADQGRHDEARDMVRARLAALPQPPVGADLAAADALLALTPGPPA